MERTYSNPIPVLTKAQYYTVPSMAELCSLTDEELSRVRNFTVGHVEFGECMWPALTDVRGLNVDELVTFRKHAVEVYDDDCGDKPPQGCGLNKRTHVSLFGFWPPAFDEDGNERDATGDEARKYANQMATSIESANDGITFDSYSLANGELKFTVEHWTVYGILQRRGHSQTPSVRVAKLQRITDATEKRTAHDFADKSAEEFEADFRTDAGASQHSSDVELAAFPASDPLLYDSQFTSTEPMAGDRKREEDCAVASAVDADMCELFEIARERMLFPRDDDSARILADKTQCLEQNALWLDSRKLPLAHSRTVSMTASGIAALYSDSHNSFEVRQTAATTMQPLLGRSLYVQMLHSLMGTHFALYNCHDGVDFSRPLQSQKLLIAGTWLSQAPRQRLFTAASKYSTVMEGVLERHSCNAQKSPNYLEADLSTRCLRTFVNCWKLVAALWAPQFGANERSALGLPFCASHTGASEMSEAFGRRLALLQWLEAAVRPTVDASIASARRRLEDSALLSPLNADNLQCSVLFLLLSSNRCEAAVMAAVEFGNLRMATLIAQSRRGAVAEKESDYWPCVAMKAQIATWLSDGSWQQLSEYRRKVYVLLSGDCRQLTATAQLSWYQCLLISLTHSTPLQTPLCEVLADFCEKKRPFDICYQLLRLFAGIGVEDFGKADSCPLLDSGSYQPTAFEHSLSWLLQDLLFDSGVLHGTLPGNHRLNGQFATQLAAAGLWQWAAYVSLHAWHRCRRHAEAHAMCNAMAKAIVDKHLANGVLAIGCRQIADDCDESDEQMPSVEATDSAMPQTEKSTVQWKATVIFEERILKRIDDLWKNEENLRESLSEVFAQIGCDLESANALHCLLCAGFPLPLLFLAMANALEAHSQNVTAVNLLMKAGRSFARFAAENALADSRTLQRAVETANGLVPQMWRRAGHLYCTRVFPQSIVDEQSSIASLRVALNILRHLAKRREVMSAFWKPLGAVFVDFLKLNTADTTRGKLAAENALSLKSRIEESIDFIGATDDLLFAAFVLLQRRLDTFIVSMTDYSCNFY